MLKQLTRKDPRTLWLVWADGHAGPVSLRRLRDRCPCAECAGETMVLHSYVPPPPDTTAPGRYVLSSATPVGSYALQLTWGDQHSTGIYTWEYLRSLCECAECMRGEGGAQREAGQDKM